MRKSWKAYLARLFSLATLTSFVVSVSANLMTNALFPPARVPDTSPPPNQAIRINGVPSRLIGGQALPSAWISGEARGLTDRSANYVVIYTLTNRWYVQPTPERPYTAIDVEGRWGTYIHRGAYYAALLVDHRFKPPAQVDSLPTESPGVITWAVVEGHGYTLIYIVISFPLAMLFYWWWGKRKAANGIFADRK